MWFVCCCHPVLRGPRVEGHDRNNANNSNTNNSSTNNTTSTTTTTTFTKHSNDNNNNTTTTTTTATTTTNNNNNDDSNTDNSSTNNTTTTTTTNHNSNSKITVTAPRGPRGEGHEEGRARGHRRQGAHVSIAIVSITSIIVEHRARITSTILLLIIVTTMKLSGIINVSIIIIINVITSILS